METYYNFVETTWSNTKQYRLRDNVGDTGHLTWGLRKSNNEPAEILTLRSKIYIYMKNAATTMTRMMRPGNCSGLKNPPNNIAKILVEYFIYWEKWYNLRQRGPLLPLKGSYMLMEIGDCAQWKLNPVTNWVWLLFTASDGLACLCLCSRYLH